MRPDILDICREAKTHHASLRQVRRKEIFGPERAPLSPCLLPVSAQTVNEDNADALLSMWMQYNVAVYLLYSRAPIWLVHYVQLTLRILDISHEVIFGLSIGKRESLVFDGGVGTAS